MARSARKHSEYGYMHLIVRGNGRQIIFEEEPDYLYYLHLLKRFSKETGVIICAYCLMENHVHLLICDREQNVSLFMKKLGVAYSYYFNNKYHRTGHLFQDRFGSSVIESDDLLLTVFRYILNNPRSAGICSAAEYPWSSYKYYGSPESFVDTKILVELLGNFREYESFIEAKYEDEPLKTEKIWHDDEWAKSIIRESLQIDSGTILQSYDQERRNRAIKILKEKGLSIRQIERLTGISKSVIHRA